MHYYATMWQLNAHNYHLSNKKVCVAVFNNDSVYSLDVMKMQYYH